MKHKRLFLLIPGSLLLPAATLALTLPPIGGGESPSPKGVVIAVCIPPAPSSTSSGSCSSSGSGSSSCSSSAGSVSVPSRIIAVEASAELPSEIASELEATVGDTCPNYLDKAKELGGQCTPTAGDGTIYLPCNF